MKHIHQVPATRQKCNRWFFITLTLLLLSLALSGCGADFGFGQSTNSDTTEPARRIEAAAERAEAAADRVEEAAQQAETAAQAVEAAAGTAIAQMTASPTATPDVIPPPTAQATPSPFPEETNRADREADFADLDRDEAEFADLENDEADLADFESDGNNAADSDEEMAVAADAGDEEAETNTTQESESDQTEADTTAGEAEEEEKEETDGTALERAFGRDETGEADGEPIKVGVMTTLTGLYAAAGEDGLRGLDMALAEFNGQVNGRPIDTIIEITDGDAPNEALDVARQLIEEAEVDILLGPLTGHDGLIIRDIAKNNPDKTFLSGVVESQDITLRHPAPNVFRFNMDSAQWMAGLGDYVYKEKAYRRVATLATDTALPYSQVGGFVIDFCQAGGDVSETFWVPPETTDFSGIIAVLPDDIDALYIGLDGPDSLTFLEQYQTADGTLPLIASSLTLDPILLEGVGDELAAYMVGTPAAGPVAAANPDPDWERFVESYREMFPDGFGTPSPFAHSYYLNAKAMMFALREVEGDLADEQQAFQEALSDMSFDSPTGPVRLDENRQAISSNFITEVTRDDDGNLYTEFIAEVPNVNQTLGLDSEAYLELGPLSRNNPLCEDVKALAAPEDEVAE